jgi:hypothetical protein
VVIRRQPVQLKDVQQVVELAVHVAAHGDMAAFRDRHIHDGRQSREQGLHAQQNDEGVSGGAEAISRRVALAGRQRGAPAVQNFLVPEVLDHLKLREGASERSA